VYPQLIHLPSGVSAFVFSEISTPLEDSIGNGWYYTTFAVILFLGECALVSVGYKDEISKFLRKSKDDESREEKEGDV
jgi:hypothetical protein